MEILILGLAIFFGIHLLPSIPPLHAALKEKLGEKNFKITFAVIAVAGLAVIIFGMGRIEFTPLYAPPTWGKHATGLFMLIAVYCMISIGVKTSLRKITAHPMLWGISAWSTGHLIANGDLASVMLFGSFLIYSQFGIFSANRRGAQPNGTSLVLKTDFIVLGCSILAMLCLVAYHESFAGVPLIG